MRAARVKLAPVDAPQARGREAYVAKLLEGLAITEGDHVRATLMGTRTRDFIVLKTVPKGPVVIHQATAIEVEQQPTGGPQQQRIAYEDIGGLKRELAPIREMIELPLALSGNLRTAGHRPAEGRIALRSARLRQDADRPCGGERNRRQVFRTSTVRRSSTSSTARSKRTCGRSSTRRQAGAQHHFHRRNRQHRSKARQLWAVSSRSKNEWLRNCCR